MRVKKSAAPFVPQERNFPILRDAVQHCKGCDLYRNATQAVFGEGPTHAPVMFVGEQPGDQEDRQGHPFVGPAGRIWDQALDEAGIDRLKTFVTNAVKHFKFEERGKRRLHKKPLSSEIEACRPWLEAELDLVQPRLVVALGATAAQALAGPDVRITRDRGQWRKLPENRQLLMTIHPSFLLRQQDEESKEQEYARFVEDLRIVARKMRAEAL